MTERRRPAYQTEPTGLRDAIWERGHITPWELFRICAWKSARGLAPLSLNDEGFIVERTTETIRHLEPVKSFDALGTAPDWDQWQDRVAWGVGSARNGTGLLGLAGIGYPVATAVLCILNPKGFPVMDRWALEAIYGRGTSPGPHYKAARYRAFAEELASRGQHEPGVSSIHAFDQRLMNEAMIADKERRAMAGALD